MTITEETSPWPRNAGTDRLFELWKQTASDIGMGVEPESRGGLSDGNHLWGYFPTLDGLGPAGDNDHCSERSADGTKLPEFVERDSFVPKAALNMCALVRLLETSGIR
jgi:glutamate carboxypeptidase